MLRSLSVVIFVSTLPLLRAGARQVCMAASGLTITSTVPGTRMPVFGLGTWRSDKGKVKEAVTEALRLGYRHIDAAQVYANQNEVGEGIEEAIKKGYVKLEDLWITSKIWNNDHRPEYVRPACERILRELKIPKINHLIIHWPVTFQRVPDGSGGLDWLPKDESGTILVDSQASLLDTWRELEKLVDAGLVDTIGVSNFSIEELQAILDIARIKPLSNQVECHPYFNQNKLRSFLKSHGIALVAYSPLGNFNPSDLSAPSPLRDETVISLASKYKKSPAQLLIRWSMQKGNVVIPKSVTAARIAENADVFDFEISPEDMESLESFKQQRLANPPFRAGGAPVFTD